MYRVGGYKVMITGVDGFIGSHVASLALREGLRVVGVTLPNTDGIGTRVRETLGASDIETFAIEANNYAKFREVLQRCQVDAILHLAGVTSRDRSPEAWVHCTDGNAVFTAVVLASIAEIPREDRPVVVMPGTQLEYGLAPMPWTEDQQTFPANPYGVSKLAATHLLLAAIRTKILKGCVARLGIVSGPGQDTSFLIPEVICKAIRGIDIKMTEGKQRRCFVYVEDVAQFLLELARRLVRQESVPALINMPALEPIRIVDMAQRILTLMENPVKLLVGALPQRKDEQIEAWLDSSLAKSMKLITLTSLEEGLQQTVEWYRKNEWYIPSTLIRQGRPIV